MPENIVRARSIPDLLALVPHLLGFHPQDSLVIIGVKSPRDRVAVTLRYDLPAEAGEVASAVSHAMGVLRAQNVTGLVAVVYGTGQQAAPIVARLTGAAEEAGIPVHDVLRVNGGRYWSYTCASSDCCPLEGTPFTPGSPAGLDKPVLAARAALAVSITPLRDGAGSRQLAIERAADTDLTMALNAVQSLIARYQASEDFATEDEVATTLVGLQRLRVRDDAWARMDPAFTDAHLRLWTDLTRRAQPGYVAAPASLLAFVAWQSGNGALANVALDRALADDPAYSIAALLRQVITAGAPPSMARLPMTPEEVAASYEAADKD